MMLSLPSTFNDTSSLLFCQPLHLDLFRLYIRFLTFFLLYSTAIKQNFLSLGKALLQILSLRLKSLTANNELMVLINLIPILGLKISHQVLIY